jgi:glycosyltransferase involved in cell wall biosynthesis
MLISVIVPVYNVEKYLHRCIDSILTQTNSDLEVILINDGSTDKSLEICEFFAVLDKRIKIINQENKGPAAARNAGINVAKGVYIGFVDADDFIEPAMYENMMNIAKNTSAEVIVTNFKAFNSSNDSFKIIDNNLPYNKLLNQSEIKQFFINPYYGGYLGIIPSLWNKIYKLEFLKINKFKIDESRVRAEDYWFNFFIFQKASSVFALDVANYHYYKNDGSVMHSFRENQFEGFLDTRKNLLLNNLKLNIEINYLIFNEEFINNTNEFILLSIINSRKDIVFNILKNIEFLDAYSSIYPKTLHSKLIKFFLKYRLFTVSFILYKIWSSKIQKI